MEGDPTLLHRALVFVLALGAGCAVENAASPPADSGVAIVKGGDARTGEYEAVESWWKPAPDHVDGRTWGEVSGVAVDTPDRILVVIWGDRNAAGEERGGSSNYLVAVNRNGYWNSRIVKYDDGYG